MSTDINGASLPVNGALAIASQPNGRKANKSQSKDGDEFRYEAETYSITNCSSDWIEVFRGGEDRDDTVEHPDANEWEGN